MTITTGARFIGSACHGVGREGVLAAVVLFAACNFCTAVVIAQESSAVSSSAASSTGVAPVTIEPKPLTLAPGKPMSALSLVTEPPPLEGALSWTIEMRKHRGITAAMAVSPDGRRIVTGGLDGGLRIWDMATGKLIRVIVGHNATISSLSWSPDGDTIASAGSNDSTMRLWNAHTGMPLRVFRAPKEYAGRVAWSPDGTRLLASGGRSGWVWLWNASSDQGRVITEVGQDVLSLDWAPNGQLFAVSIIQGSVSVVAVATGKTAEALDDPATAHYSVRWSPDGTKLFVGSAAKSVIYAMPGSTPLHTLAAAGFGAAWSPDGGQLCTTNQGGVANLWNVETGKSLKTFTVAGTELHWRLPEQLLVRGQGNVAAWSPADGKELVNHRVSRLAPPYWSPGGRPIITGLGSPTLSLWENSTAKFLRKLEGHSSRIGAFAWSKDGKVLATAAGDGIRLWDSATGTVLHSLTDHKGAVLSIAWSPDGKLLASGGADNLVRLWQPSGKLLGTLEGHTKPVTVLAWSPRSNLLASATPTPAPVRLWQIDKQKLNVALTTDQPIYSLAFSPDGALLAGGNYGPLHLWNPGTGKLVTADSRSRGWPRVVNHLAWAPDSSAILLTGSGGTATALWDWQSLKTIRTYAASAPIHYISFAPGATMVIAGSGDGIVRFWDSSTGRMTGAILDEDDHLVLLSSNGNYRIDADYEPDFVFVLQAEKEQVVLDVAEFAAKYKWKNVPALVKFTGK